MNVHTSASWCLFKKCGWACSSFETSEPAQWSVSSNTAQWSVSSVKPEKSVRGPAAALRACEYFQFKSIRLM